MTHQDNMKLRQERGNQRLNIGDRVRVYDRGGNLMYGGKTGVIIEKAKLFSESDSLYYGLYVEGVTDVKQRFLPDRQEILGNTSYFAPFFAEDLELVEEAKEFDKVNVREKADVGELDESKMKGAEITIPVKVDWAAYRNELAKEVALKSANGQTVKDVNLADYVVDYATKVTENLCKTQQSFLQTIKNQTK